jgi:putative FmdB family regulatory protein
MKGSIAMPTYQYACTDPDCGNQFEQFQAFSDPSLTECPVCSQRVRKVYGSVGVVFKGSGFYRNDSRDAKVPANASAAGSDAKADSATSSDSSSPAKSDSAKGSAKDSSSGSAAKAESSSPGSASSASSGSSSDGGSSKGSSNGSKGSSGTSSSKAAAAR